MAHSSVHLLNVGEEEEEPTGLSASSRTPVPRPSSTVEVMFASLTETLSQIASTQNNMTQRLNTIATAQTDMASRQASSDRVLTFVAECQDEQNGQVSVLLDRVSRVEDSIHDTGTLGSTSNPDRERYSVDVQKDAAFGHWVTSGDADGGRGDRGWEASAAGGALRRSVRLQSMLKPDFRALGGLGHSSRIPS